jgi:hypothetical protein
VVEKLLSLITFFAAAKKVIPPPGRRLLNEQQANRSVFHKTSIAEKKKPQKQTGFRPLTHRDRAKSVHAAPEP